MSELIANQGGEDAKMPHQAVSPLLDALRLIFKPHPWHGIEIGTGAPAVVTAYIEIVPSDTVKYEIDKPSGHLKVDRPQQFSNICPTLYGFIPQTYCGDSVGEFSARQSGHTSLHGDGDPLDICVLAEKSLSHGDVIVQARPIGGLRMIDRNEADDKILAVLEGDAVFGTCQDIGDIPTALVERLRHYFLTYKQAPGATAAPVAITHAYSRAEAFEVIRRSCADYQQRFGAAHALLRDIQA